VRVLNSLKFLNIFSSTQICSECSEKNENIGRNRKDSNTGTGTFHIAMLIMTVMSMPQKISLKKD